jgi:5-methylcytosine-specific restriction endonuclease McrA
MALVYQNERAGKICTKCGNWRPVERFRKRLLSRDGYNSMCRECENENSRRWRSNNRDHVTELNREYYEANREERLKYHRQYRQENREYFQEKMEEFREQNPAYHRDYMREWACANPDKIKAQDNARRAFKKGQEGSFSAEEWEVLKRRYNYTCLRCGRREPEIKLTADHIVPISKGGSGTIENIQPLCGACNTAKHARIIDYRPNWEAS